MSVENILDYINNLEIIDTHEHLPANEIERNLDADVLIEYFSEYISSDLISAGLRLNDYEKIYRKDIPLLERFRLIDPYLKHVRFTGYHRALEISVKELYGINKIDGSTVELLNERFIQSLHPGHFENVLKKRSKIHISLLDDVENVLDCDKNLFRGVYRLNNFIYPRTYDDIAKVENDYTTRICSIDDWLEACEAALVGALKKGAVALKCNLAYLRPIRFKRVSKHEAENDFNTIFRYKHFPKWEKSILCVGSNLQDYMMHHILRIANKNNLVFQFHTGMLEGNGNYIENSRPSLLSNLFLEYNDVRFDLFHAGYPYQNELSVLAKMYPNVFIDMCWAHIISPAACISALNEWIDAVPINKISAFGGDHHFVDGVYGHQYLARMNVSHVLNQKIQNGNIGVDEAKQIASMIFYENPKQLYRLT